MLPHTLPIQTTRFYRLALLCLALLPAACGGGGGGSVATPPAPVVVTPAPPPPPAVSSISATVVSTGQTITLTGTGLDQVSKVVLGGITVQPASISATQIQLAAPAAPTSTVVQLLLTNGGTLTLAQTVRVDPVITVSTWTPRSGLSTSTTHITISGTGLAKGNGVAAAQLGGQAVTISSQSDAQLVVDVPAGSVSGALTLLSNLPGFSFSVGSFDVVPGVVVTGMTPSAGPQGTSVRVSGSSLNSVTAVTVGGQAANITAQSATALDFAAPAQSGTVVLSAPLGQSVTAGSFTYEPPAPPPTPQVSVSFAQVDLAQTFSQPVEAGSTVALVYGKAALLRAFVVGSAAVSAPTITASLEGCPGSPSLVLKGPALLPTTKPALTDLVNTFSATVPAACVTSALRLSLSAAASANTMAAAAATLTPRVARTDTSMDLVLVPLVTNGVTARTPTAADIAAINSMFDTVFPLGGTPRITVRAPFTLATTSVTGSSGWSAALSEVRKLADAEGKGKQYYGLVPLPGFTSGTVGNAYVNTAGSTAASAWMAAIGTDSGLSSWITTMAHEVGHNNSLEHAPCGTSDGNPASRPYPYADAALGPYPIYDRGRDPAAMFQPSTTPTSRSAEHDLMSYCNGGWLSDFNYANIQSFHNSFSYASVRPFAQAIEMLDFSGEIVDGQVRLWPTTARMSLQPYAGSGEWSLHLALADGSVVSERFQPVRLGDGTTPTMHFEVSVPRSADVTAVQVRHGDQTFSPTLLLPPPARLQRSASGTGTLAVPASRAAGVAWSESAGRLLLTWDAARYPALAVRHKDPKGATTVLALQLHGGSAELPLTGLGAGGEWEFSLSSGFTAQVQRAAR